MRNVLFEQSNVFVRSQKEGNVNELFLMAICGGKDEAFNLK